MDVRELLELAFANLENSYSPYSQFNVSAVLCTESGRIYTGCNIENASYSATVCAERTAFFKAVSEGETKFEKIAIIGGRHGIVEDYCPPCGVCLQVMDEFCNSDKFEIIIAKSLEEYKIFKLKELLPYGFTL